MNYGLNLKASQEFNHENTRNNTKAGKQVVFRFVLFRVFSWLRFTPFPKS